MSDAISRSYAIDQMETAFMESNDPEEKIQIRKFIDFLEVLPDYNDDDDEYNGEYDNDSDDDDYCYECTGYGDDYYEDENGEMVSACEDCPYNPSRDDWDY